MRIERLGLNKIKIILETEEMLKWDLNFESLSEDSTRSQEMFWDVMRKVEDEMGMNFENCRITVEAVPAENNTLVMIITKTDLDNQMKDGFANATVRKYKYRVKKQAKQNQLPVLVFEFLAFDDICSFVDSLGDYAQAYESESSLFKHKDRYYLAIYVPSDIKVNVSDFSSIVAEYGKLVDNSMIKLAVLSEHGEIMIKDNALNVFNSYFSSSKIV